jgi:hypothetical protein
VLSNNTFAGDRSEEGRAHIAQDSRPILTLCTPRLEQFVLADGQIDWREAQLTGRAGRARSSSAAHVRDEGVKDYSR